ncbi:MAG: serine/threonine protein kinase, partial [Chloroflexi bacterium]|nr:serine/threonine protein kinase [Chloroflexota bacterium]
MTSERVQRRIDGLLDQAEEAVVARDWSAVDEIAQSVLAVDPENGDAVAFLAMAAPHVGSADGAQTSAGSGSASPVGKSPLPVTEGEGEGRTAVASASTPTSFADGRYQVSKFLGEGGKKRVYLAHDTLLDRDVAFALIKTEGFDDTSKERITREAQAMGRLGTHPNIVTVFDLGTEDDAPFMVTELMGGGDVEGLLEDAEDNRLSLGQTIEMGKAICEGLQFAHSQGVIHRDIKP